MYKIQLLLGECNFLEASRVYLTINEIYEKTEYSLLASFFCIIGCNDDTSLLQVLRDDKNNEEGMRIILDKFLDNLLINKNIINDVRDICQQVLDIDQYQFYLLEAINNHNYKIIEKYYSSINFTTFTSLMDLEETELIKKISFMVNSKRSQCKINQKERLVVFDNKIMSNGVDELMDNLIKVDHLIHKESFSK